MVLPSLCNKGSDQSPRPRPIVFLRILHEVFAFYHPLPLVFIVKKEELPCEEHVGTCPPVACAPGVGDVKRAIIFHMACLTKDSELGMRILRIVVEMSSSKPNRIGASIDFSPTDFPLLGTADFTGPSCLLFACFGSFIPIGRIAFFVPWHSGKDVLMQKEI